MSELIRRLKRGQYHVSSFRYIQTNETNKSVIKSVCQLGHTTCRWWCGATDNYALVYARILR